MRVLRNLMNHGQLQHGHSLAFSELRHEHVASIWKFNRIMVTMRNIRVYRAEFPACIRADQHAQGRWLADPRHKTHRSAD